MKLIVGLGNPGIEYENTRHNIGFKAIDAIAHHLSVKLNKSKFSGLFYQGKDFILAKPLTYMNLSGDFIIKIINYFKINLEDILIIYDDIALEPGKISLKKKGSSNGHNGIADIINKTKSNQIARLKIGIGKPSNNQVDFVLGNFSVSELKIIDPLKKQIIDAILNFINFDLNVAINKLKQN